MGGGGGTQGWEAERPWGFTKGVGRDKEGGEAARGAEVMRGEKGNRRWGGGDVDGRHSKELSEEEKGIGPSRGAVLLPSPRAPSPGCSPHVPQQQQPCFRATIASWLSEQG